MNSNLQQEFDDIVRENVEEFGMDEEGAAADALQQLKTQKHIEYVAKTSAERQRQQEIKQLCGTTPNFAENLDDIHKLLVGAAEPGMRNILIYELLLQGGIGGAMHCAITHVEKRGLACELICLLCESCELTRSAVPPIALGAFVDFLAKLVVEQKALVSSPPALRALLALMRNHEDNKQVLYEKGLNQVLHELFLNGTGEHDVMMLACALVREYCLETALTQISNNSFTRCRKLGEDTCVVEALTKQFIVDGSTVALDALRLVCVNDAVCNLAIRHGALDRVLQTDHEQPLLLLPALTFVRQLCLNDEAKRRIGRVDGFTQLLLNCLEQDEDAALTNMALSITCAIELRQPAICSKLAEQGIIPLYVQLINSSQQQREMCKLALMGLRNLLSHPDNAELKQVALTQYGAEAACRHAASNHPLLTIYAQDCLRDLGLAHFKI